MTNILFVCLGNICRSPMAEAIFNDQLKESGLSGLISCDSAGTANYHVGDPPDARTLKILANHHIKTNHIGQQLTSADFDFYDFIIVMDHENRKNATKLAGTAQEINKIKLFGEFDSKSPGGIVPDPYYGTLSDFENVYAMCLRCSHGLIDFLKPKLYA